MQKYKIISLALAFVALFFILNVFYKKERLVSFKKNNITVYLEVADTEKKREYGLMNRKSMPKNHGMIFIFPKPEILRFWMKNTLIPLDMIFLNHGRVVAVIADVPPCKTSFCRSYGPDLLADEVIELNAGMTKQLEIITSNQVRYMHNAIF